MRLRIAVWMLSLTLFSCVSFREVQLTGVEFRSISTENNKLRATFDLKVDNPNAYPIRLSKPRLKVFIGNEELQHWEVSPKIKLKKCSQQSYPFYVQVSGTEVVKILPLLFTRPKLKVEGTIKAGSFIFGKRIPVIIEERLY